MILKKTLIATSAAAFGLSLSACSAEVKDNGKLPTVDVNATAGRLPDVDVKTADVKMETKKVQVDVPTVDVTMPSEKK